MDKEQAKQFLRLQEHDKFFVSLLQELGCHSDFVAFDKSTRGHDLLAITERMSALLERIPGWNRLRIVVANRYISENRYDEALSILEPGLEFPADLADVQVLVFKIYARNKDRRARDFLNLLGPRFLRNQQGLLALIAYDCLLETFEDFTLCTNIAAYLCSKAIPLPSEFYRFVFDWSLNNKSSADKFEDLAGRFTKCAAEQARLAALWALVQGQPGAGSLLRDAFEGATLDVAFMATLGTALSEGRIEPQSFGARPALANLPLAPRLACEANRTGREARVALCLSGQMRDMAQAQPQILRLADEIKADMFIATWENNGVRFPTSAHLSHLKRMMPHDVVEYFLEKKLTGQDILDRWPSIQRWIRNLATVSEDSIRPHYPSARIAIHTDQFEDLDYIEKTFGAKWTATGSVHIPNQLRMAFLIREVAAMALSHAPYDVVVRLRPDALFDFNAGKLAEDIERVRREPNTILVDRMDQPGAPSDSFAIGSAYAMSWYAAWIDVAPAYGNDAYYPERMAPHKGLYDHLVSGGFRVAVSDSVRLVGFASPEITSAHLKQMIIDDCRRGDADSIDRDCLDILQGDLPVEPPGGAQPLQPPA